MFRLLKRLFILAVIVFTGITVWTLLALWAGFYSVYSYPPSDQYPKGTALIIERDDREPMFNSQFYIPEKQKKPATDNGGGIGFGMTEFTRKKPIEPRVVFTLPYIEWAFEQSLNEEQIRKFREGKLRLKPKKLP